MSRVYYDAHPDAMQPDEFGEFPDAEVIERKITVGFHNGFVFLETPFTTTLQPVLDEEIGDGFDLMFNGYLELQKFIKHNEIPVVFIIEYKLKILTNQISSPKKSAFGSIIEKISGIHSTETKTVEVERDVCMGWGFWSPSSGFGKS